MSSGQRAELSRHTLTPGAVTGGPGDPPMHEPGSRETALVQEGYADRIHMGHDAACFYDFMVDHPFFAEEKPDYLLISREILPALEENGVSREIQ